MKKRFRFLTLLLALVMSVSLLTACSGGSSEGQGGSKYEKMTIGMFCLNWTSSPYSEWKAYLEEYVGPHYNVEFEFNTEASDPEGEKAFMEKMGALGAKAVIGIVTQNLDNCLEIASQYGMTYVGGTIMDYDLSTMSQEKIDAFGGIVGQSSDYRITAGYDVAMAVLSQLDQTAPITVKALGLNPAAGLPPTAGPLLQMQGFEQAIEELRSNGVEIDFEQVYPSGAAAADWSAAAENALAGIGDTENAALLTASTIDNTMQAVLNSGSNVLYGGFSGVTIGNEQYFKDGLITASGETGLPCAIPAACFVMAYNAATDHKITDSEGNPVTVEQVSPITVSSYEDYQEILEHIYVNKGETYYTTDVLDQYLYVENDQVTLDSYTEFVNADLRN